MSNTMELTCPDCLELVRIPEDKRPLLVDHIILCDTCGAEIRITATDPLSYEVLEEEK